MRIIYLLLLFFCFQSINSQKLENHLQIEVDKWQKELVLNGDVGPRCYKDYFKWAEEFPQYYYGLQDIKYFVNKNDYDDIKDAVFFFPAINCVGGSSSASDFALHVYSYDGNTYTNYNITTKIENSIKYILTEKGMKNVSYVKIYYKSYIGGNFYVWREDDANCCSSFEGRFVYNTKTLDVSVYKK